MIICFEKKIGQNMTEVIEDAKKIYKYDKITYAGRLDPLAFGSIIILTDEDIHKRDEYTGFSKVYEFKIIHGTQTDSFDILGLITNISDNELHLENIVMGDQVMEYPRYSAVPIKEHKNKPYWWCTAHGLTVLNKPTKNITLFELEILDSSVVTKSELLDDIKTRIDTITSKTFRQDEILEKWATVPEKEYHITKIRIHLSSGGYVRHFANLLGGCAFDICRKEYCHNLI